MQNQKLGNYSNKSSIFNHRHRFIPSNRAQLIKMIQRSQQITMQEPGT